MSPRYLRFWRAEINKVLAEKVGEKLHEEEDVPVLLLLGLLAEVLLANLDQN